MSTYDFDLLRGKGVEPLMALLIREIINGQEPFITYGDVASHLETELKIPKIFSTHPGAVAGELMHRIWDEADEDAPPINSLITRPTGIPGVGAAGFIEEYYGKEKKKYWKSLTAKKRLDLVAKIRAEVREYGQWERVYKKLFKAELDDKEPRRKFTEKDGKPPESKKRKGVGESAQHLRLKEWVSKNPKAIGIPARFELIEMEADLPSGDSVDVLFGHGNDFIPVEVKSVWSGEDDHRRGLYQCVKYREVIRARELPIEADVRAILVTELPLTAKLHDERKRLGVKHIQKKLNKLPVGKKA